MQPENTPQYQPEMQPQSSRYTSPEQEALAIKRRARLIFQLAFGLVLFLVVVFVYNVYSMHKFRVVSTNPNTGNVATVTPFFKVTFNRQLSKNGLSVGSNPSIISSYSVDGDTLDINLNPPFDTAKTYTITINSISDASGKTLTDKVFSFQPLQFNSQDLPQDQQQALLKNQTQYKQQHDDPILSYLPYSSLDFSLNYNYITQDNKPKLILQAQLLLAPGISGNAAAAATSQYKQEVLNFIKSKGLDPAKYTIQYQVVQESLTGA